MYCNWCRGSGAKGKGAPGGKGKGAFDDKNDKKGGAKANAAHKKLLAQLRTQVLHNVALQQCSVRLGHASSPHLFVPVILWARRHHLQLLTRATVDTVFLMCGADLECWG